MKYSIINGVANIDEDTPIRQSKHNTLAKDHFQLIGNGVFVGPRHLAGNAGGTRFTCITFSGPPTSWSFASSFAVGQQSGTAKIRALGGLNLIYNAIYVGGEPERRDRVLFHLTGGKREQRARPQSVLESSRLGRLLAIYAR